MLRYFAIGWNVGDPIQCDAAETVAHALVQGESGWGLIYAASGFKVYSSQPGLLLPNRAGVIVGPIFGGDPSKCAAILDSRGRALVDRFWGAYVAFLVSPDDNHHWVLRAPRGFLPCFTTPYRRATLYFSSMEDCAALDLMPFSVNWKALALSVVYGGAGPSGSAIQEVSEVKPGECIDVRPAGTSRQFYWDPATIARSDIIDDPVQAASSMRATLKTCVHQWVSSHEAIVHKLSGGIDSSIVLGCLQDAPTRPKIIATTDYSEGAHADERHYARLSAQRANCELRERRRDPALNLELAFGAIRTVVPMAYHLALITDRPAVDLAITRGCTAVFSGVQGDAVFHRHPALPAAAEYLYHHGLRPAALRVAWDVAYLERRSIAAVLYAALKDRFGRARPDFWTIRRSMLDASPSKSLVNRNVIEALRRDDSLIDPWLRHAGDVPPGKIWQIFALTIGSSCNDPFGEADDPEAIHPLVSQPLTDLCLRIPTYLHVHGGWDRAIARKAFEQDVPVEILHRTGKGGIMEHTKALIARHRELIRARVLDGALVREGLLDRSMLADALAERPMRTSVTPSELLRYFAVEVWLEIWASRNRLSSRQREYCSTLRAPASS
jgi:asparagine synthase (glutamine-hydrolysing)